MKDLNKILLIGRLGKDPVLRSTKTGMNVAHFPLATSRRVIKDRADDGGESDEKKAEVETVWHKVYVWGRQGEACAKYLTKGRSVYVEGSMRSRSYTGKDGTQRMSFEVHAESVGFLGSPGGRKAEEMLEEPLAQPFGMDAMEAS